VTYASVLTAPRQDPEAPDRVLVVIGGLPGSGKTTLLRRLLAEESPGMTGLDSEQVTARLRGSGRIPYRLLRPWVHVLHRWRVLRVIGSDVPVVVLTDPWTSARWREVVRWVAGRAGRSLRLVLLEVSPEMAVSGQAARGRAISPRAMGRHTARWSRLLQEVDATSASVVDRPGADRMTSADLRP
jgi:predicted kinase